MSHVNPIGLALAGVNVLVAVLLVASVAFALGDPVSTGGTLLVATILVLPLLALPYRSLLTVNASAE